MIYNKNSTKSKFISTQPNYFLSKILNKTSKSPRCKSDPSVLRTFPKCILENKIENEKIDQQLKNNTISEIQEQFKTTPNFIIKSQTAKTPYLVNEDPYSLNEIHTKSLPSLKLLKHFKIKGPVSKEKTMKNIQGKQISLDLIKEISKKETMITKLENKHIYNISPEFPLTMTLKFESKIYVQHYIKRFTKLKSLDMKSLTSHPVSLVFSEENFLQLISSFYLKKMLNCTDLMKYFHGKDTLKIVNHIGKYLYNNLFVPIETSQSSLEYLENIHKRLNISNSDYNCYKGLFIINMRENGISESNVQMLNVRLEKYRPYITRNLKIEHLNPEFQGNLDFYLNAVHDNIKENGIAGPVFYKTSDQVALFHHRKVFMNVVLGHDNYCHNAKKINFIKETHQKMGVGWRECFEMKKIFLNNLFTNREEVQQTEDFDFFRQNLQNLHKYILVEPNPYLLDDLTINLSLFIIDFTNMLKKNKELSKLFDTWTNARLQEHSKYMCEFLLQSKKNSYKLNDLIPAHCKVLILKKEFDSVQKSFQASLFHFNLNKNEELLYKLMLQFERTRHYISREKNLFVKIGGLTTLNYFFDNIYVYLLGSEETKGFFVNSDKEYVKFKQKLFFSRLLSSEINHVDLIDLRAIHYKMGVKSEHFNAFMNFCEVSLIDLKVNDQCLALFLEKIRGLKPYICE